MDDTVHTSTDMAGSTPTTSWTSTLAGGAIGGLVGSLAFGLLMWGVSPTFLEASIPALYGLEPTTATGWAIHIGHGVLLGLVFGALVGWGPIEEWLLADVETQALSSTGTRFRYTAAGAVYGIAIWALLPMLLMPVWLDAIGEGGGVAGAGIGAESLFGHVVYGLLLGLICAVVVRRR